MLYLYNEKNSEYIIYMINITLLNTFIHISINANEQSVFGKN